MKALTKKLIPSAHLLAVAAAVAAALGVALGGATVIEVAGVPALTLNAVSASVLVLVALVGLVVSSFTARYSRDDPRLLRLRLLILAATLASCVFAAAGSILVLAGAWILTSAALALLLAHRTEAPGAAQTLPAALRALVAADALLLTATAIVVVTAGNVALPISESARAELAAAEVLGVDAAALAALLAVGAALGRCAQLPFGAWLMQTVAVPTPVSAMLHAGIVNGGALLLIALAPVVTASEPAMVVLFTVAAASMLAGTGAMVARPDVKGALALSTRGQMAFMLIACALGAFAAAIFHLVAHAMYKAALFLGSGSAIDEHRRLSEAPPRLVAPAQGPRARRQAAAATLVPALLFTAATVLLAPGTVDDPGALALLAFAWATAAQASWWWLRLREPQGRTLVAGAAALALFVIAYVGLLAGAKELLGPDLPPLGDAVLPEALIVPVILAAFGATALRWLSAAGALAPRTSGRWAQLRRRAYARALAAGSPRLRRPLRTPAVAAAPGSGEVGR